MRKKSDDLSRTRANSPRFTRRTAIKGAALAAGAGIAGGVTGVLPNGLIGAARAASDDGPLRIGFQVHRTGIGATYGRWYERTTNAAVKLINDMGGIAGRPIELITEDDGTDPRRGAEVDRNWPASTESISFSAPSFRMS